MRLSLSLSTMALLLYACAPSLTPYTQKLHEKYDWKESDLKKVQFYLSSDIVLRRKMTEGKAEVVNGDIKIVHGSRYEVITFRRGTPGVLLFMPKENRMAISFEDNIDDTAYLMFGPNPKYGNNYLLLASDWNEQSGDVTYLGKKWETNTNSAFAGLLVNLQAIEHQESSVHVAQGRVIK